MPVNPRYADVRSVIDHGCKTKSLVDSDSLIAKKKGENFGRIKPSNLAKFLEESNNSESVFGLMQHDKENMDCISQVGSVARTSASQLAGVSAETKFLLLDMREEDEYLKWHIKEAINFPAPNMHRDKTFA